MNEPDKHETIARRVTRYHEAQTRANAKALCAGDIVPNVGAITLEWLNDVLSHAIGDRQVTKFRIEEVSLGTHARHRLHLTYDSQDSTQDLPETLFSKTLPDVQTRMISGITRHARVEGSFYMRMRPELHLEIPRGYHSTFDPDSCAAIHLLEDLSATRGAVFCDWRTKVTKDMAEDMVGLLAGVHGHFYNDPRFAKEFSWIVSFGRWFRGGIEKLRLEHYNDMAMTQSAHLIPERLLRQRDKVWPAALAALEVHDRFPPTFIHSDVHIGNWYRTGEGRMGLCDWQCAARGHFSRDLAYVISAGLEVEDRRDWERDLIRSYVEQLSAHARRDFDADDAFKHYRHGMLQALLMWTPTLCHSEHLPDMQPEAASLCMIERMTAAIDDLDALDVLS